MEGQDQEEAAESTKEQGTARNGDNLNKSPGTGMRVAQMKDPKGRQIFPRSFITISQQPFRKAAAANVLFLTGNI